MINLFSFMSMNRHPLKSNRLKTSFGEKMDRRQKSIAPNLSEFKQKQLLPLTYTNKRQLRTVNCKTPVLTMNTSLKDGLVQEKINILPKLSSSLLKVSKNKMSTNTFQGLNITTRSWCLFDSHREKYIGFRQDYKREIASLTKIMTAYITIQLLEKWKISFDCTVKVTNTAANMIGTRAQLKQGLWISIEDLLYGTMLPSGNDAAYMLAQYMGYILSQKNTKQMVNSIKLIRRIDIRGVNTNSYVQQFIRNMNERSISLNLASTRYSNPHGLQNALNTSSAKDIITLSVLASKNKHFKKIMNTQYHKCQLFEGENMRRHSIRLWQNTNKLLMKDWEGVKTGHTSSAGNCLSSLKDGIFIVVLNSSDSQTRFSDTEGILSWYSQKFLSPKQIDKARSIDKTRSSMMTETSI